MTGNVSDLVYQLSRCRIDNFTPFVIGEGTFGAVTRISPTMVEKTGRFFEDEHCDENITEVAFLSTYKGLPFIPEVEDVRVDGKTISFSQSYEGTTLNELAKTLTMTQRIQMLPSLMVQMARALVWMKENKIVHMDIKPDNICVNSEGKVTFIDWGFACRETVFGPCYNGTEVTSDPTRLLLEEEEKTPNECCTDMFAVGMSLLYFIRKQYVNYKLWASINKLKSLSHMQERVWALCKFFEMKEFIVSVLPNGEKIFSLLESMILIDKTARITPEALYRDEIFQKERESWPLVTKKFSQPPLDIDKEQEDFLLEKVDEAEDNMYVVHHAISIFLRYLEKKGEKEEDEELLFSASMYIAKLTWGGGACVAEHCSTHITLFCRKVEEILQCLEWRVFCTGTEYDFLDLSWNKELVREVLYELYIHRSGLLLTLHERRCKVVDMCWDRRYKMH